MLSYSVFGVISIAYQRDRRSRRCWLNDTGNRMQQNFSKRKFLHYMQGAGTSAHSPYTNNATFTLIPSYIRHFSASRSCTSVKRARRMMSRAAESDKGAAQFLYSAYSPSYFAACSIVSSGRGLDIDYASSLILHAGGAKFA